MKFLLLIFFLLGPWVYAQNSLDHHLVINPKGHMSLIHSMTQDPKGKIVTGSYDKRVYVWNPKTGRIESEFLGQIGPGAEGMVYALDVSPNGKYLAVAGWMGKDDESENLGHIRLYNYETGKMLALLKFHEDVVLSLGFNVDSKKLISADASGNMYRWDVESKVPDLRYDKVNEEINNMQVGDDYIVTSHGDGMVYKWDLEKSKPKKEIDLYVKKMVTVVRSEVVVSPDNEYVAAAGKIIGMVSVFDRKMKLQSYFFVEDSEIIQMAFAPSNNRMAVSIDGPKGLDYVKIYDLEGKEWKEIASEEFDDLVACVEFIDENTVIAAGGRDNAICIYDIKKGELIEKTRMEGKGQNYYSANLKDDQLAFTHVPTRAYGRSEYTEMFDLFKRKSLSGNLNFDGFGRPERDKGDWKIWEYDFVRKDYLDPSQVLLIEHNGQINDSILIHPWTGSRFYAYALIRDDLIAIGGGNGILQIHDRQGRLVLRLVGHEGGLRSVCLSENGKFLVSSGVDMTVRFWSMEEIDNKKSASRQGEINPTASFFMSNDNEWVLWNQEGYFTSSKKGARYVGYHVNYGKDQAAKFYPFDQFDLKFNRPDILMKDLDLADEGIIELYYMAYLKRLKRMGLTEEDLSDKIHTPEIVQFEAKRSVDQLVISIQAKDDLYTLNRLNVYLNDVPIYGRKGLKIKNGQKFTEQKLELDLISGENKVEVSVMNDAGVESLRETIYVDGAKNAKRELYVAAIGVSNYEQSDFNLNYAAKDAGDIVEVFNSQTVYDKVKTKLLTDDQVNRENIFELKEFFQSARANDVVMLFIAGHGVLDVNLDYFFCTHDMDFQDPGKNGVSYAELEVLFDGIKAIRKLLIMDTCHSGELFKDEVEEVIIEEDETEDDIAFRSNKGTTTVRTRQGLKKTNEAVKEMFNDLNRGTGATVISSAGGVEYAMESDEWKNGLFTYCLLEGLKDKSADANNDDMVFLSELQSYIVNQVVKLSNGKQQPTSRFENLSLDYRIW